MPLDIGNMAGWVNGHASPTTPVTDLSPHVDGGPVNAQRDSNANAGGAKTALNIGAAYVIGALLLLWFMGVIVVKSANF